MRRTAMAQYVNRLTEISAALKAIKDVFDVEKGEDMRRMTDKLAVAESAVDDATFDLIEIVERAQ